MRRRAKLGRLAQAMIRTPLYALRWLGHLLRPSTPSAPVGMVHAQITFHSFPGALRDRNRKNGEVDSRGSRACP
jgi:hypothetical protein